MMVMFKLNACHKSLCECLFYCCLLTYTSFTLESKGFFIYFMAMDLFNE